MRKIRGSMFLPEGILWGWLTLGRPGLMVSGSQALRVVICGESKDDRSLAGKI